MTARLMAVAGPHEGTTFPLPEGEFAIGHDAGKGLSARLAADIVRENVGMIECGHRARFALADH
jgi:hypothetical protein